MKSIKSLGQANSVQWCRRKMLNWSLETCRSSCKKIADGLQSTWSRLYGTSRNRPFVVCVEGNIGSGKTSLLKHFETCRQAQVYMEPTDKWRNIQGHNGLALMYENPGRWSLTFQTYVQLTMLQTHLAKQKQAVKLMERSIFSAKYCFVENLRNGGIMPELEYIVLTRWFDHIIEHENCNPDLIVYLQTNPEVLHERIKKRCRKEETGIPMDYLQSLHDLHEDWLIHQTKFSVPCPVLVLDANLDIQDMLNVYDDHRDKILCGFG